MAYKQEEGMKDRNISFQLSVFDDCTYISKWTDLEVKI